MYKSDSNQQKYIDINISKFNCAVFAWVGAGIFPSGANRGTPLYSLCRTDSVEDEFHVLCFQYTWRCKKGIVQSFPQMGLNISGTLRNVPIFWVIVKELILNSWLKPWLSVQCLMWCVSLAAAGRHSVMFSVCIRYMAKNNDYVMMSCPVCWSTGSR